LTPVFEGAFLASPVMLPGGRAVLYGFVEGGTERVTVFDLETQTPKALFEGQNATYVPTGHIVFARGTTLMAAPFDAAELAVTGEAVAMLENVRHPSSVTAADYAISATGTLVYVPNDGDTGGRAAVVFVDRAGNVAGRAVSELLDNPRDPRLSPDGTRLFLTTGSIPESDIWSYDLGGRPPLPLAVTGNNRNGVVSPDGRRIIFGAYVNDTALPELHTLPTDGSVLAPQPLRADALLGAARFWSAAGELFFVSIRDGNNPDILATPAAARGDVREVVATEYAEFDPALSPNGRWLAYASERSGRVEVWVMGYPDGAPVRVSGSGGFEPRWSADGRELYYLQGSALMMVAVETEREFSFAPPVQLFTGRYRAEPAGAAISYDVAPDGGFVMIESSGNTGGSASIVVVQNWFEELKRRAPAN
jgi:serine/threonine-protein kinase